MDTTTIVTLVVAIFGSQGFWTWLTNRGKRKSDERRLLLGIAYRSIIEVSELYIKRGNITADEYHELEHYLYEPYKNMGGDGTAEKMMNDVKALPIQGQG